MRAELDLFTRFYKYSPRRKFLIFSEDWSCGFSGGGREELLFFSYREMRASLGISLIFARGIRSRIRSTAAFIYDACVRRVQSKRRCPLLLSFSRQGIYRK